MGLRFWAEDITRNHPDKGKRVLGLLGVGLGLLVHQVAMHCFERGALMAALWNMHTALMDVEVLSLEEHIQVSPDAVALQRVQWQQWDTLGQLHVVLCLC